MPTASPSSLLVNAAQPGLRHPRRALLLAAAVFLVAVAVGGNLPNLLHFSRAFEDPSSESAAALQDVERATGMAGGGGIVVVVKAAPGTSRVAAVARTLRAQDDIATVRVPTSPGRSALISRNGEETLVLASLRAGTVPEIAVAKIIDRFKGVSDVLLGGADVATTQITEQATADLAKAELLAFPILALLSLLIFRGVAAFLPLIGAAVTIPVTFMLLRGVNALVPLSPFSLNLVLGLGLGLAVDYSLFMVWRLREELANEVDVRKAVTATIASAGRTVIWSAITVAAAMSCLTVFPQRFLVSMGIGGAVVTLVAALAALTVLPPLFMLLGPRIGRIRPGPDEEGRWYRLTKRIARHPGAVALLVAVPLLILATPALRASWSGIDARVLPTDQSSRIVVDRLGEGFPRVDIWPTEAIVTAPPSARGGVERLASRLGGLAGVRGVSPPQLLGRTTWRIELHAFGAAIDPVAQTLVERARSLPSRYPVSVGGPAAEFHDQRAAIARTLPLAIALLVLLTLLILWLMTGSVVLPLKMLAMNLLTTAAATGVLVLIFQDGRLTGPLGFHANGGLEQTDFVVFVALVFALSTDYGVFLLTRIQELRREGFSNEEAVAVGLQRTGRIITAAAVLLAVALASLATSDLVFLKELGVGAACAVILDAWLVRGLLVPALMTLLGDWNWWSPAALRHLHERLGNTLSIPEAEKSF